MTTGFDSNLREGLQRLAEAPPAPALADEALANARRIRRRRRTIAALAATAVVGVGTAMPLLLTTESGYVPFGPRPTGTAPSETVRPPVECRTATNEAVPPGGAVPDTWPSFVGIVLAHLPPRDDYHLSSAVGMFCDTDPKAGRMVMSFGEGDAHGQFALELFTDFYQLLPAGETPAMTCAALTAEWQEVYSCTDATSTEPLVVGGRDEPGDVYFMALYPDGRFVFIEDNRSGIAQETLLAIVTDPALAALLE
jgi:hypothetical protein